MQIEGEKLVLKANGANGTLATCALRPSGLFGPGDTTFWPTVVAKANQGKMKYIIGDGRNLVEFTYVGNVAQAHLEVIFILAVLCLHWGNKCKQLACDCPGELLRALLMGVTAGSAEVAVPEHTLRSA